ncbi:MAG: thioredoxin TrxA [Thermodesulfobacteriota bacterium]
MAEDMKNMENIVNVTDSSFETEVLKSEVPAVIDFWAEWCAPCKAIAPIIEEMAGNYEGKIKIAKMNVDENPGTPGKYGVRGIPTLILFKNGEVVDQLVGAVPKAKIQELIDKAL